MSIKAIKGIITYKSKYLLQLRDNKRESHSQITGVFWWTKRWKETIIKQL